MPKIGISKMGLARQTPTDNNWRQARSKVLAVTMPEIFRFSF
jgi:hypothetical protein